MLYVGVDAGRVESQVTVMNATGQVLKRKRVASSRAGLSEALNGYHEPMKAVLEAGYNWARCMIGWQRSRRTSSWPIP